MAAPQHDLRISTVLPIPKSENVTITASTNYHGIALRSILVNIFYLVVFKRHADLLSTNVSQFGFKAGDMCTLVSKDTIEYYSINGSVVYCTVLDATKAFDRVNYYKLFRILLQRIFRQ